MHALVDSLAATTGRTLLVLALLVALILTAAVKGFGMSVIGAFGLYFVLWWTFLFAVLPLGNAPERDPDRIVAGQDPGAPALPRLREKALLTTLVAAAALFLAVGVFPLARL